VGSVSGWAYTSMGWAVGNGLIGGVKSGNITYLDPHGNATRAQAAIIFMNYCQLIGQ